MFSFFRKKEASSEIEDGVVITDPAEPKRLIRNVDDLKAYAAQTSKLSQSQKCVEISNILAAKYNLTVMPSNIANFQTIHGLIGDLNDRIFMIFTQLYGLQKIQQFSNNNTHYFNSVIKEIDEEVSVNQDITPREYGQRILTKFERLL